TEQYESDNQRNRGKTGTDDGQRRLPTADRDDAGEQNTEQALAHDHAGCAEYTQTFGKRGFAAALGPAVIPIAEHGSNHNRQRELHGQIDTDTHRQRRQLPTTRALEHGIGDDHDDADDHPATDQAPIDITTDHAFGQG